MIIFLTYLVLYSAFIVRRLGELIRAFLLHTTPVEIIILLIILTASYIASMEINIIARAGYFIYPIILIFVGLFFLISLPTADFSNLLPTLDADFSKIPQGIRKSYFSFTGFEILLFALPYVEDKKKALKSSFIGLGIVTFIYIFLFLISLTQFHLKQLQRQAYPLFMIAKSVDLPGYFLQNLDGLVVAIWIVIVFGTFAPALFGGGKILANIFKTKTHSPFVLGLVTVIYFVALIPDNYLEVQNKMLKLSNMFAFFSVTLIPLLILTISTIRRKMKR